MTTTTYVRPSAIRFSAESIDPQFAYRTLEDSFQELLKDKKKLDNIPPILVMDCAKGFLARLLSRPDYMVVDGNRRLYLYRKLEALKEITKVKVMVDDFDEEFLSTRILLNNGKDVLVRSGHGGYDLEKRLSVVYEKIQSDRKMPMLFIALLVYVVALLLIFIYK